MYRIGIIGTENSHALAFAKYFNLPDPETSKMHYEDVRVTTILGTDQTANKTIIKETGVKEIKALVAQLREDGKFMGTSMSFRISIDSPYDGIYFYASSAEQFVKPVHMIAAIQKAMLSGETVSM